MTFPLLRVILENPLVRELTAEATRTGSLKLLLYVLEGRFGPLPSALRSALSAETARTLFRLARPVALCGSLGEFVNALNQERGRASPKRKCRPRKPPV